MIRVLALPALCLSAVFAVLISGFRLQPPRDLIRATCDTTAPCWQQFQPGVTSYEQTTSLFQNMGWSMDSPNCQVYMPTCQSFQWRNPQQQAQKAVANFNQGRIAVILFLTPNVTLGEMLLTFGMPSQTDEYADFDLQGRRFIVYRSLWRDLSAEVDLDCPMTFATLLEQPVHVITNPFQPVDPGVRSILSHDFLAGLPLMIRLSVSVSILLVLVFALVIGGLHVQPHDNPALSAFGDCSLPCWQGLKIGVTSADEAVSHIHALGGLDVAQAPCYISEFCVMYTWRFSDTQALYAFVLVNYGRIASIDASTPGFSLGEALLALKDFSVNGGDLDVSVANQFHVNLHVAESSLILQTVTPCPGSYRELLETPVRVLELEAPDQNGQFPRPVLNFPMFHRTFNRVCAGL